MVFLRKTMFLSKGDHGIIINHIMFGVSPNQMEKALFLTNNQKIESVEDQEGNFTLHQEIVPLYTKNEPSIDALTVNQL